MARLSASDGDCPKSTFIMVAGAKNSTKAPAVARPVINRMSSIRAASIILPAKCRCEEASAPGGALARNRPLLAAVRLDRGLDLLLHGLHVEAGPLLHRGELDEGL